TGPFTGTRRTANGTAWPARRSSSQVNLACVTCTPIFNALPVSGCRNETAGPWWARSGSIPGAGTGHGPILDRRQDNERNSDERGRGGRVCRPLPRHGRWRASVGPVLEVWRSGCDFVLLLH